jgi:cell division protein FtsQ
MDGGGCLDQSLMRSGSQAADETGPACAEPLRRVGDDAACGYRDRFARLALRRRLLRRTGGLITRLLLPSGLGIAGSIMLLAATLAYGAIAGGHVGATIAWLKGVRDDAANAIGFRIAAVSLTGQNELSREEILATAGVTGRASLLFLDAGAARARLLANPWIADAAVFKLYPDRLQISITERRPFALWQKDGRVRVIAADGTVLEPFVEARFLGLPFVVGRGAERAAKSFLAVLDHYPDLRAQVRAAILVAERRWNLRLKNGIDVRLPEAAVEQALERLVALDRDKKLLSRDIVAVDLRLPDRVTVRLSDAAAQAREDAFKDKKKKKAGDA